MGCVLVLYVTNVIPVMISLFSFSSGNYKINQLLGAFHKLVSINLWFQLREWVFVVDVSRAKPSTNWSVYACRGRARQTTNRYDNNNYHPIKNPPYFYKLFGDSVRTRFSFSQNITPIATICTIKSFRMICKGKGEKYLFLI